MAGISGPTRLTGFSGALDTEGLIQKLMQTERLPLVNIQKKKQQALWKREDYQNMNKVMLSFRNTMNNLRFEKNFEKITATSTNPSVLSISAGGANIGTSNVEVKQLAESATVISNKLSYKPGESMGLAGTIDLPALAGGNNVSIQVTADSTIDNVVKDINMNAATTGVRASFDASSGHLFLTSTTTGQNAKVQVSGSLSASFFSTTDATGKDAKYLVNGTEITASSNNVMINGAQVLLTGVGTASIGTNVDKSGVVEDIKKFVAEYNALVDLFNIATTTKISRDYTPLTDEEKEAMSESQIEKWEKKAREGILYNDSILKDTLTTMRQSLNTPLNVSKDQISMLSQIGITVKSDWRENGKLEIDEAKLEDAITSNFEQVKQLFVMTSSAAKVPGKSNEGIADRLYNTLNEQMETIKKKIGVGAADTIDDSVMGKQLKELNAQEVRWKSKLLDIENRYYKQFTAMETALQKMNAQQASLSSLLGG
ncbi:flagellar filament capping protein FliD [Paenibacillus sp. Cedars]|uniref:flagellar filament capping protein FliD n=1 Tax=Paenibacillus sp. Cedars TaxID=1980674 RepID=UPI001161EACB|nr:flagellar filament capping protein FliD [Paenibacillus sp. Cedars]AWP25430.1 flagellar hook protein [Paenibacillus sp. Cedars]